MGRGSRHSKNAGTMGTEGLTYHEKRAMGFGTLKERLGKDAQGNFYDCCLTLQPAVDPVITRTGHLFSREAILEYYLVQKKHQQRQIKEWEADQQRVNDLGARQRQIQEQAKLEIFERQNVTSASDRTTDALARQAQSQTDALKSRQDAEASAFSIQANAKRAKEAKSFWQPQDTPDSDVRADKPSADVLCPISGKKLRIKDLTPVKLTPAEDGNDGEYIDPVSLDVLRNTSKLVVLKPTGDMVSEKTYRTCIKPDGTYKGHRVTDKDIIHLVAGATGFAGRDGQKLQSEKKYVLGPGSGMADLRGQAAGGASRFGLAFQN
eukprot:jgi/Ulvmu1/9273/UM050_0022.1